MNNSRPPVSNPAHSVTLRELAPKILTPLRRATYVMIALAIIGALSRVMTTPVWHIWDVIQVFGDVTATVALLLAINAWTWCVRWQINGWPPRRTPVILWFFGLYTWPDEPTANNLPSFICPECERRNYHPGDIQHLYCPSCRVFFSPDDPRLALRSRAT